MVNNKKVFIIVLFLFFMLISQARAEEPDWNTLIPIIIQIESSGNPNAISQDGCQGLMQISELVLEEWKDNTYFYQDIYGKVWHLRPDYFTKEHLFIPEFNKAVGTWYLKRIWFHYLPHYKIPQTIDNLLIAYNFGIGNLVKYHKGKVKLPAETKRYLWLYRKYEKSR